MPKLVQEQFGQDIIDSITKFVKQDIPSVEDYKNNQFSHVDEPDIKQALADTMYGARWIYKLGFALLVKEEALYAHVRSQTIDYASVCENLLGEMIIYGISGNHFTGTQYQSTSNNNNNRITWNNINIRNKVEKTKFSWRILVSEEEGIINTPTRTLLDSLKKQRNTVHITEKVRSGTSYYIGLASKAHRIALEVINQTKIWKQNHP